MNLKNVFRSIAIVAAIAAAGGASAASGEMGTGVPTFGNYSAAAGLLMQTNVWSIANPTRPFPAGCSNLVLSASTMGVDAYKLAVGILIAAKLAERPVRFYAHVERDGGCGVDYVQLD